jgi:alcohol dehydrogenase class IV
MAVTNFRFTVSGRIEFEAGSSRKIGDHVRGFGGQKVFISTDKGVVDAKLLDGAISSLEQKSIPYVIFDEVEPNPSYETVEKGYGIYKDQEIIADSYNNRFLLLKLDNLIPAIAQT